MLQSVLQQFLFILFPLAVAYAGAGDLLTMTISNKISLGLVACFLLLAPLTGMSLEAFGLHWAAGGLVLAVGFVLFACGWVGGGDAKLAAAIALWLGWDHAIEFIGLSAIFGGVLTLLILSFRNSVLPLPAFVIRQPWIQRLHDAKEGVPYGVALAAGALAVYPQTIWVQVVLG